MKKYMVVISLLFSSNITHAEFELETLHDYVTLAHLAGICTNIRQMSLFQIVNDIEGGEDFYRSFLKTEAERSGISTAEFLKTCKEARRLYKEMEQVAQEPKN